MEVILQDREKFDERQRVREASLGEHPRRRSRAASQSRITRVASKLPTTHGVDVEIGRGTVSNNQDDAAIQKVTEESTVPRRMEGTRLLGTSVEQTPMDGMDRHLWEQGMESARSGHQVARSGCKQPVSIST